MKKNCVICGNEFDARRKSSKYCLEHIWGNSKGKKGGVKIKSTEESLKSAMILSLILDKSPSRTILAALDCFGLIRFSQSDFAMISGISEGGYSQLKSRVMEKLTKYSQLTETEAVIKMIKTYERTKKHN